MAGTKAGAIKTRNKIYELYGKDFYVNAGRKGGKKVGVMKGFAVNRELAAEAGRKGGAISKRGKVK